MRITGYSQKDFTRVMEINDACYSGIYCPPSATVHDMVTVSDVFLACQQEGIQRQYGAEIIVGFAIVQNVFQPYLWNLAVHPDYQGKGVGGLLLRHLITTYTASGQNKISLHVSVENPAQKLYFDNGFRVVRFEDDYFDPNDGLLMERKLP